MRVLDTNFLHNGDLRDDFLLVAGLNQLILDKPNYRANPNIDHAILEVFKSLSFLFENSHDNYIFNWVLEYFSDELTNIRSTLPSSLRARILKAHFETNNDILNRFFKGKEQLFWTVFSAEPKEGLSTTPCAETEGLSILTEEIERLRRALGYTIGALAREHEAGIQRVQSTEGKIKMLERRIAHLEAKTLR